MPEDHPVTELWQVITGQQEGRKTAQEVTLFDGVGFAIEDFTALRYVHQKIQNTPFYIDIDLIADPDDPRDLFGMLKRAG
jgi:ornithine cyclodeaminase